MLMIAGPDALAGNWSEARPFTSRSRSSNSGRRTRFRPAALAGGMIEREQCPGSLRRTAAEARQEPRIWISWKADRSTHGSVNE
jgi:hypothetical protein